MNERKQKTKHPLIEVRSYFFQNKKNKYIFFSIFIFALFAVLYLTSRVNFLLFHSFSDMITIFIAVGVFVIIWNGRHLLDNHYYLCISTGFLFFAIFDFLHLLGQKGMGVFPQFGNLGPTFYIISRYILSITFLLAPFFIKRKVRSTVLFTVYSLISILLLLSVFYWKNFPVAYIEGTGLTPFKIISDYVIGFLLLAAIGLLLHNRREFDPKVMKYILFSLILSIGTGIAFTLYSNPFDIMNTVGHFFQIASFYLVYRTFVETGLVRPQNLLFRNLTQNNEERKADLVIANRELIFQTIEKADRAAELVIADKELAFQTGEKADRAAELIIANEELAYQTGEKSDRAAELVIANKELAFQTEEKADRAAELLIANKELAFQNEEKEKRAAELVVANKELVYQSEEKEKRAAELIFANKELVFQNEEKEKHATELIIANEELAFQNVEKEKRAAELIIANKELAFQSKEIKRRIKELALAKKQVEMAGVIINKTWKYDRSLIKASIDPIMTIDQDGLIIDVNTAVENATGLLRKKLIGANFSEIFSDQEKARNYSQTVFEKGQAFNYELDLKHINGFTTPVIYNAFVYSDNKEKRVGVLVANNDNKTKQNDEIIYLQVNLNQLIKQRTNELKIANKKLAAENEKNEYLGYHDHLTGLYNRRFFEKEVKRLDTKTNLPISIIMCDTNGLKLINDSFGHNFGDMLLVKAAETIKKACRADDIVARIGGDEFAVLLPKADAEETVEIANNIKQLASKVEIANIELSISYGYATKTSDKQKTIEVMANAENHMYRHKLYERSSIRNKTIDLIMNTLFEKSDRESQHSARVSNICQAIASKMNFDKVDVNKIRIAGLVHDIGKMGIDEKILNKAGKLDDFEWEQMKGHSEAGWRILSSANEFSELAQFVLDHHERWDGGGYPNGLKGEKIPLESKIIAIADAYDAMTSERSYRKGWDKEKAINELKRCSGTQFDTEIVDVFVNQVLPHNIDFGGGKSLLSAVDKVVKFGDKPS